MPYIKTKQRHHLRDGMVQNSGELNYKITELLTDYIRCHGLCYKNINDMIGALEGAKMELYRRVVAPYEDLKIKENGDVYEK